MPSGTNNIPALAAVKSCTHQKQKDDGSLCWCLYPWKREKLTELLEEVWDLCVYNRLGVVAAYTVILSDQSASGLKKTNVILQHSGKQGLPTVLCSIDTCVWLQARLGQDSTGSTPPVLGGLFQSSNSAETGYAQTQGGLLSRSLGAQGKNKLLTGDLICPCKYTGEKYCG